jgi:polyisoprenoid-binding protein YceI
MKPIRNILIVAAITLGALAAQAANPGLVVQPASKVWISGTSTLHAWHANASKVAITFQAAELTEAATPVEAMEKLIRAKAVSGLDLAITVTDLKSGKDGLDKNMYKALLAEKHPQIRFAMTGYEVAGGEGPVPMTINARGKLTVAGVDREIKIPVAVKHEGEGLRLTGEVPLLMTQFGIKPPTMMMGTVKTGDEVVVHFDLVALAGAVTTAAQPDGR